jgi:hypothetical protein
MKRVLRGSGPGGEEAGVSGQGRAGGWGRKEAPTFARGDASIAG